MDSNWAPVYWSPEHQGYARHFQNVGISKFEREFPSGTHIYIEYHEYRLWERFAEYRNWNRRKAMTLRGKLNIGELEWVREKGSHATAWAFKHRSSGVGEREGRRTQASARPFNEGRLVMIVGD